MGRPRSSHGDRHYHDIIGHTAPKEKQWHDFNPAPRKPTVLKHRHPIMNVSQTEQPDDRHATRRPAPLVGMEVVGQIRCPEELPSWWPAEEIGVVEADYIEQERTIAARLQPF